MAVGPRFTDKVAIVTGGGMGIGAACCEGLACEGAKVVIAEIDEVAGAAMAKKLKDEGGEAHFIQTDATEPKSIEAMIAATVAKYGRIDYLVNNAGGGPVEWNGIEMSLDDWNFVQKFNLTGPWYTTVQVSREMKKTGGGAIVNLSSMAGIRFSHYTNIAYSTAKAAIVHLTLYSAHHLAADNIRVNCVAPGMTITPTNVAVMGEVAVQTALEQMSMLPRYAVPEDQAGAILYLLSDVASYVTGQTIRVDGGWYTK